MTSAHRRGAWYAAALLLALSGAVGGARADDVAAGRAKAQPCAVCHGPLGLSAAPDAPHLAGQPAIYLARQLKAYRSGARSHEVMSVMARGLSDDDITELSAWFASLQVDVKPPR